VSMPQRGRPRRKERVRRARSALYRQLVLEAAERIFAEKGAADTKMEEIAAESGLSLGTVYSVYSGKAEIVQAIHESRLAEVLQRTVDVARAVRDPLERLLRGVRATLEFFVLHPEYLRLHLGEGYAWGLGDAAATSRQQVAAWREGVAMQRALFARGVEEGLFHPGDPELMARMMIAMQQVQLASWVESGMQRAPEELVAEMEQLVRRSFCLRT
jgi:AcrR family transcriptional regulator